MILPTPDHYSTAATPATDTPPSTAVGRRPAPSGLAPSDRAELATLVREAQAGEPAAQTALVRKYTRRIAGYVRLIIRQPDAVEDVVQMIFIKMFRRLGRLRDSAAFESWLFRLARNTAVDFIRRRRCRPITVPVETDAMEIPDPADASATGEIMDALEAALTQVGPTDRKLVTHFVQGTSYQSLARQNGLTLGAVKARLHRMRPFLRSYVGHALATHSPAATPGGAGPRAHLAALHGSGFPARETPSRVDPKTSPRPRHEDLTPVVSAGCKLPAPADCAASSRDRNRRGGGKTPDGIRMIRAGFTRA